MSKYVYEAINEEGETVGGKIEAKSEDEVYTKLSKENLYVSKVENISEKKSFLDSILKRDSFKKKVKIGDVLVFTRQLATILHAGLPLLDGLNIMIEQVENPGFKKVISELVDSIKSGNSFSDALREHPKVFSEMYVSMVEAGEEGGVLDDILHRVMKIMEKNEDTKNKIKSAFTYPVIIVFIAIVVVGFLVTFVFPTFIKLFLKNNISLPLPTQLLFSTSNFIKGNLHFLIIGLIIAIVFFKKYRNTEKGRSVTDNVILKIPMIGELITKVTLSRFARTLSTLYTSGVQILRALEIVQKSVTNKVISSWLDKVYEEVKKGESLAKPMAETGNFPPMLVQMVATGEQTGAVSEMLSEIARAYDVEVDYTVERVTAAIEPLLIVFMGILVAFIALALFLPMLDMMSMVR